MNSVIIEKNRKVLIVINEKTSITELLIIFPIKRYKVSKLKNLYLSGILLYLLLILDLIRQ